MSNVFLKALIGSKQSKYTAMAIIATLVIISLAILFVESDVSYTNRVVLILFILLVSLPGILLSLVELTCLISGGSYSGANKPSWCWVLAWIIAIVTILYCVLIVISTFNTLFTYKKANKNLEEYNNYGKEKAEHFAKQLFVNKPFDTPDIKPLELFNNDNVVEEPQQPQQPQQQPRDVEEILVSNQQPGEETPTGLIDDDKYASVV
tara:strand:+ start:1042 stop:1662 length:621 start_codon:yes stop_codon:yes gene_type:complete